jgi:predicted TIM-barrel fold metal-dependent hydrolase
MRLFIATAIVLCGQCFSGAGYAQTSPRADVRVQSATLGPAVDHHEHLLSPRAAALLQGADDSSTSSKPLHLPVEILRLLQLREKAWNDPAALSRLYSEGAIANDSRPIYGRMDVGKFVGTRFAAPYEITPLAFTELGSAAQLAALYTRGGGESRTNVGLGLLTLVKTDSGHWQIASEAMKFPGPSDLKTVDASQLVQSMDDASIDRAVVLSAAYFFESPLMPQDANAPDQLRAENDWTALQVARYPKRLIGFCSVNPLTGTALPEIQRCATSLHLQGLKLHFGNSDVDVRKTEDLAKLQRVFHEANRLGLPIVVHLWTGPHYGRSEAEIFLKYLLPQAPDVCVQVAHMAGGGPGWTDEALAVFADAIQKGDPRTKHLYFDVATVADRQTHSQLQMLANRIRQIGVKRILYGSDAAFGGRNTPDEEWGTFRGMVPLTDEEFSVIRANVAPYLQ